MPQEAATVTWLHFLLGKIEVSCCIIQNAEPYFLSISRSRLGSGSLVLSGGWCKRLWWWKCECEDVQVCQWGGGSCVPTQWYARQSRRMKDKGCHWKVATVTKDSPFSLFLVDALFLDLCIYWRLQLFFKSVWVIKILAADCHQLIITEIAIIATCLLD